MSTDEALDNAWMRARGQCECERVSHGRHGARCDTPLLWAARGTALRLGAWEAYRTGDFTRGHWEVVNGYEILCWACFRQARRVSRVTTHPAAARPIGL